MSQKEINFNHEIKILCKEKNVEIDKNSSIFLSEFVKLFITKMITYASLLVQSSKKKNNS